MPQLSVVIIGRNEGQRLVDCIHSVQIMDFPQDQLEIIYVDSNSTDGSPARAKELGAQVLTVCPERPAAAIGRNAGWQAATAPFILFLDGDTLLHSAFVKVALSHFTNPKIAVVWGHRRERYPNASLYQRILDLDWVYAPGFTDYCGGDAVIRRTVLEEIGGYNPRLIAGEEPEMCQRMRARGYSILHIDHPMTEHDLAITRWSQYWRRSTRTGHAFAEISNLLRQTDYPLWQREAKRNLIHTNILVDIFLAGLIASYVFQSAWPILLAFGLFLGLSVRSAWKARWKSNNFITLFLYGLHSQFQQLPITCGQIGYYYYRWRNQHRRLIEYK